MKRFVRRALAKLEKLDPQSIRSLIEAVSTENELFDMVMDSMASGIVVLDGASHVLLANKASERLIPMDRADLLEGPIWDAVSDQEIAEFLKDRLEKQERVTERDFALEESGPRIVSISILPLVASGEIHGSLLTIEDVTERRANDARLRRAESLAALTTLTAGVAHEIKNPLASIGIHLQLMQKQLKGREEVRAADLKQYLDIVGEEVDRLNMIVVDYLMAVRPTEGQLEPGDINEVIRDITAFLQFELKEAHVELIEEFSEIPQIELDEKSLKQALLNLIKNAIEAMPRGGTLWIGTSRQRDRVTVKIRDTGVGIPGDLVGKIFEPYFTTKDSSSGLGLTVVYKIMKEHHGEVSVSSHEGEGTTFTLTFPVPQGKRRLIAYEGEEQE
jgi:two-component system, sporulation sensor kinase E